VIFQIFVLSFLAAFLEEVAEGLRIVIENELGEGRRSE